MGDEEDPAILGAVRVEGAEPGLAEAGREDDEPGGVSVGAGFLQRGERFELDRVRRDDCLRFEFDIDGRGRGLRPGGDLPALAVAVDPRGRQLPRGRVLEEALEDLGDTGEGRGVRRGDRAVAPFDAGQERRLGEVGAADEGHAVAAGAHEDVGFGVEGDGTPASRFEHPELAVALEVEQADKCVGVSDAEVVAGQQAQTAAALEEVAEVRLDAVDAAGHHEADGDIDLVGAGELLAETMQQRVVGAAGDEAGAVGGGRFGGGGLRRNRSS